MAGQGLWKVSRIKLHKMIQYTSVYCDDSHDNNNFKCERTVPTIGLLSVQGVHCQENPSRSSLAKLNVTPSVPVVTTAKIPSFQF